MTLTTFSSRAAAALVAAVAGFSSYRHIYDVATIAGEHHAVAVALPLSIDGLIVVGALAMLDDKRSGRHPRASARIALGFGIVATLAANIASAQPTLTARMVAAVPAVAFLIAVEVLARNGRLISRTIVHEINSAPAASPVTVTPATAGPDATQPVSRARPKTLTSAVKVERAAAKMPGATVATIAAKAGVSESTARRYLPATVASPSGPDAAETTLNGRTPDLSEVTS